MGYVIINEERERMVELVLGNRCLARPARN